VYRPCAVGGLGLAVIGSSSKKLELLALAFKSVGCSLETLLLVGRDCEPAELCDDGGRTCPSNVAFAGENGDWSGPADEAGR
jgi:hypothetical protein